MIEVTKVTNTVNRIDFVSINHMRKVGLSHLKAELKEFVKSMDDEETFSWSFIRCSSILDTLGTLQVIPVTDYSVLHNLIIRLYTYDVPLTQVLKRIDDLTERN